ncbi:MAG: vitamin K epoxide reductase family protein [Candidatus Diapherotrites archaeon]
MKKAKYIILIAIFFLSFVASAVLSFIPPEQACGGIQTTCYAVQTSEYEKTLGINNSYFGLIAFPILLILALSYIKNPRKYKRKIIIVGILFGSIIALYFLYLQFFALKALCKYCVAVDFGALLSLVIVFAWREK